jgi:hypothetical protein
MKEVRAIMITAIVLCSFISIGLANANDEEELQYNDEKTILTVTYGDKSLTMYQYYEGIKTAKETGKPILFCAPGYASWLYHHDGVNKIVNDNFIYVSYFPKDVTGQGGSEEAMLAFIYDIDYIIPFNMMVCNENQYCYFLVLDSNGREITRVVSTPDEKQLIRIDSGGTEIASLNMSAVPAEESHENFILETLEYSKTKKGKIQRLPQEKGSIDINDLSGVEDYFNFFTISGTIRDIEYTANNRYNFNIDDGTGVIGVLYTGGIGDISEGDKVFVKGLGVRVVGGSMRGYYSSKGVPMMISESISKTPIDTGTTKSSDSAPLPKTPALGAMFAITELLAVAYLLRRR